MKTITMTADVPDSMSPDDIMDAAYGAGFTGVALGIPQDDDDVEDALVDADLAKLAVEARQRING